MYFTIREQIKKQGTGAIFYTELKEMELTGMPTINDALKIDKKTYKIINVVIGDGMRKTNESKPNDENFINVILVSNNYKNDTIKKLARRDRYQHEIIDRKDGGYYTVDKAGKRIREWDRNNVLTFGKPYPNIARAGDGI